MECTLTSATNMLHSQIICHICCRVYERNKFTLVFDREGLDSKLPEKICKYTPFTVKSESHSSAVICTACVENLNSWDRYIQSCIEAHLALPEETEWKGEMTGESVEDLTVSQTIIHFSEPIQHSDNMKQMSEADMLDISSTVCKKKYCEKSRNTYCIAKWCSNNTGDNNISFFRVPKDRQRAEQWLLNADRGDLLNKDIKILHSKYLCEKHFSDTMFMNKKHKRLVWNAIPSIFPDINSSSCGPTNKDPTSNLGKECASPVSTSTTFQSEKEILAQHVVSCQLQHSTSHVLNYDEGTAFYK